MSACAMCELPARHKMAVDGVELAVVCCVHADEVMAAAGSTESLAEAVEGWGKWRVAHRNMCGTTQEVTGE